MSKFRIFLFLIAIIGISHATENSVPSTIFQCNLPLEEHISAKEVEVLRGELGKRFVVVFGKNWESEDVPSKRINKEAMMDIARIASCAAVVDRKYGCGSF